MAEPMTASIARTVVNGLNANFGPWPEDKKTFWASRVADLHDGEAAWDAMLAMVEGWTGPPPRYADFKQAYIRALNRLMEQRRAGRELGTGRETGPPQWYYVWKWARWYRDPKLPQDVALPQQREGYEQLDAIAVKEEASPGEPPDRYLTDEEYAALRQEWEDAGGPRVMVPGLP